jgi:hypothetical protein
MLAINQPLIDKNLERFDPRNNSERETIEEGLNMISEDLGCYVDKGFGSQQNRLRFYQGALKAAADLRQDLCAGRRLTFSSVQRDIVIERITVALNEACELPGYLEERNMDSSRDFLAQAAIDALVSVDV